MSPEHLNNDWIDNIALGLSEDVYGASGDLDEFEIRDRLIDSIHNETGYRHHASGAIPVHEVAGLLMSLWKYMDREWMTEMQARTRAEQLLKRAHQ